MATANKPLKILFVASECTPFAKVGGLADAVAALPKFLTRLGHDARVVIPLYGFLDRQAHGIVPDGNACVHLGQNTENWVGVHRARGDGGVPVYFVEFDWHFGRTGIYNGPEGDFGDNAFRFALLSKAALQIAKDRFVPDVVHCHDWPTGLVPAFLKTWDRILSPLSSTASVLTIHNIGHQGQYPAEAFDFFGLSRDLFRPEVIEDYGKVNLLKVGVQFADGLTTVSPTHAREILTPAGGRGLAPYLNNRAAVLRGILNGADYEHWSPEKDRWIPARFSVADLAGKAVCKLDVQRFLRLEERAEVPVLGIVSRLVGQKGFDLVREVLPGALSRMRFQVAMLGTGEPMYEDFFRWLARRFPGRVGEYIGFSEPVSHLIQAGADFFLMPSLYEPCGLNQFYCMRYGTLPIVRATGGLEDSVRNYDEKTGAGTGFKFYDATPDALFNTIGWAMATWYNRFEHIRTLRAQAMSEDFSWDTSAAQYVEVYRDAIARRRG